MGSHTHVGRPGFAGAALAAAVGVGVVGTGCALLTDLDNLSTKSNGKSNANSSNAPGDASSSNPDGGRNDNGEGGQTISPSGRCDLAKPFGAPVPLDALNKSGDNDRAARLTPDELTVYFSSDRSNAARIYRATRPRLEESFGAPALVDELQSALPGAFSAALPSANGLELLVEHRVTETGGARPPDLYLFTRGAPSGPFANPSPITALNTGGTETDPNFAANDLELYLARSTNDTGIDLFVARRESASPGTAFGPTSPLAGNINTNANETDPVVSADGLELFFQSDRSGPARVWVSRRSSVSEPFPEPVHVTELDGSGDNDVPNWLSADRCVLYMTSYRQGNLAHLYVATRPR